MFIVSPFPLKMLRVLVTCVCYDVNTQQCNKCRFFQAIVCSFVYDGLKTKTKTEVDKAEQTSEAHPNESPSTPPLLDTTQTMNPEVAQWPPSSRPDVRDLNTEIDLAQG